jgi:hypothetical protein
MIGFRRAARLLLGAVLVLGFGGATASAEGDAFGFEPQYWNQSMNGTIRVDGDALQGTTLDLQDTLGLPAGEKHAAGRFWLHWLKRNYLFFTTAHSDRSGDATLAAPLIFNDQTFLAGDTVSSRVETDLKSLYYGYNFIDQRLVKLGILAGVDRLGFDATLESGSTPTRASSDASVTFPVAGFGLAFEPIPLLRFIGEIDGMGGHLSGNDVHFYDARVQAELYWSHFFGITVGYRRTRIDVETGSFGAADVNQKGPYGGFVFRF